MGWLLLLVIAYVGAGAIAAVLAVETAQLFGLDPEGQRVVAFVVVGAALVLLAFNPRLRQGDPVAVAATLLGISVAVVGALSYVGPIEEEPALGCINSDGHLDATISAETAVVFSRATPASEPRRMLLRGCQIHPTGWCVGAVHGDVLEQEVRDSRWLLLPDDEGLVASGHTVGTTPPDEEPSKCPGGVGRPDQVDFTAAIVDARSSTVALQARAPRAAFIGFAMRRDDGRWARLGWDKAPEDDVALHAPMPPDAKPGAQIAAVACIAFLRPSGAVGQATLGRGRAKPTELPLVKQPVAERPGDAACNSAVPPPQ